MSIGISQRRPFRRLGNSQMLQLPFARRQAIANIPQRLRVPQLAEQHCHELSPTAKSATMPFGLMLPNRILELHPREQLQQLRENAAYSIHGGTLLKVELACLASFNLTESFRPFF